MTEKEQLIQAFKALDFEMLHKLLDDNRSYMDVPKDLFLSRLKQELDDYHELKSYEHVIEGICNHCNKGCKAYKFVAKNCPSLPLFFEEDRGKVTDIYLCYALEVESENKYDRDIFFSFYNEEKVGFKPSIDHLITLQRVDSAVEDFKKLQQVGLLPIEDVIYWHCRMKSLAEDLGLNDPFSMLEYKAFTYINAIYSKVDDLARNYNNNIKAKNALETYYKIDKEDEKSIVKWLLENQNNFFYSLKKTENWKKTGIIILETQPNLVVDCSEYLDGLLYDEIYNMHQNDIMEKYKPTETHFKQHKKGIEYSLESYLRIHNMYLDLLDNMPYEEE